MSCHNVAPAIAISGFHLELTEMCPPVTMTVYFILPTKWKVFLIIKKQCMPTVL